MYIAVILENFSQATEDVQQGLTPDDFDMYYEKWEKFDPKATKYIPLDQLSDFVDYLEEPLRLPKPNHFILVKMDIPICEDDRCYCRDILDALTKNVLGTSETVDIPQKETDKDKEEYKPVSSTLRRQKEHYAARIIQKAYRNFKNMSGGSNNEQGEFTHKPNGSDDDGPSSGVRGRSSVSHSSPSHSYRDPRSDKPSSMNYPPPPSYEDVTKGDKESQGMHTKDDKRGDSFKLTSADTLVKKSGQTSNASGAAGDDVIISLIDDSEYDPRAVELGPNSGIVA